MDVAQAGGTTLKAANLHLVTSRQAHDLVAVKANQPSLLDRCAGPGATSPSWTAPPTRRTARVELRALKAVTVGGFAVPHAAQVVQVTRKTRGVHAPRRCTTVVVDAVTSLTFAQASPPGPPSSSGGTGRSRMACTTSGM